MNTDFELCCWQRYWCCWQRVCGVCPLGEVSCRRMGAVVMILEVSICWSPLFDCGDGSWVQ